MRRTHSVALVCCFWLSSCSPNRSDVPASPEQQAAPARVEVDDRMRRQLGIQLERATVSLAVSPVKATGQLQVNEDAAWRIGSITDGRIISVPIRVGDQVKRGQVLATVHSHEVHDSRASYRQAIAALERQKAIEAQARTVRDRTRRLVELKAASREQVEAAETQYRSATAAVSAAQAEVDKAQIHLTEYLEVPIEASRRDDHSDDITIKSPASGTLMERKASAGTVVSAGDPVFTVADLTSLWLIAAVNEADMSRVRPGQRVEITVRAFADRKFGGRVLQLGERLDPQTRTLQVRVLVPNSQGLLKPDMFALAQFAIQNGRSVIQVPETAVQELNGKQVVFVQREAGSFVPQEVQTGSRTEGRLEIVSGLEPGAAVVVNGAFLLKSELLKSTN